MSVWLYRAISGYKAINIVNIVNICFGCYLFVNICGCTDVRPL